jgi:hypothetical protein
MRTKSRPRVIFAIACAAGMAAGGEAMAIAAISGLSRYGF